MIEQEKPRLARLTAILTQLQSKRMLTAREIAEKHQVSIRTVYRDIRSLEASGVPIVTEEGRGYSLMKGYHLPPVMFSENEANALVTAEQLIAKNKDASFVEYYQSAITKIKSVLKLQQKDKAELLSQRIVFRVNQENNQTSNFLMTLQTAITNFSLVKLKYHSLQNEESERMIEPFAVYSTQGNWILIAYCQLRKEFRAFRIDRMLQIDVQNTCFEPHPMTLQEYFEICRKKSLGTPDTPLS